MRKVLTQKFVEAIKETDPESAAHRLIPRSRFENGVSCVRLALPRREIPGVHFRPCRAPSASSPGRYGCADRTSGSNGSAVAPKATHPATQSSCPHCSSTASRRKPLQSVFVMESAQYRCGHDLMTERKAVSARFDSRVARPRIGNAWSQGGMWSASVVVRHPRCQDFPQMPFAQRNNPV